MQKINLWDRKTLQALRKTADQQAQKKELNPHWKKVFEDLSQAANCLDAFLARTEIGITAFIDPFPDREDPRLP